MTVRNYRLPSALQSPWLHLSRRIRMVSAVGTQPLQGRMVETSAGGCGSGAGTVAQQQRKPGQAPHLYVYRAVGGSVGRSIKDAGGFLMKTVLRLAACGALAVLAGTAWAHSGGLNTEGCHNDRKNGGYHCHRSPAAAPPNANQLAPMRASGFKGGSGSAFRSCSEARAAGAAPVRRGDPGYGSHLDRDNDGVGCE